jgi:hypothetical protein
MNRTIRTVAAIAVVSLAFQVRVTAGPRGGKPAKASVTKPAAHAVKPVKPAKTAAPAPMKPAKATTKADVKAAKTIAKSAKVTAKGDARAAKHSSTTTTGTTSGPASTTNSDNTPAPIVVSNPVADKISRNPKLAAKIASRLPSDMTLAQASTGFRNQGQFLAAVNVSKNLGIDFVKLQTAMTGQTVSVDPKTHAISTKSTGDAPLSLGRSIQTLRPGADADAAVQKAQAQTTQMVQ